MRSRRDGGIYTFIGCWTGDTVTNQCLHGFRGGPTGDMSPVEPVTNRKEGEEQKSNQEGAEATEKEGWGHMIPSWGSGPVPREGRAGKR